MRATGLTTTARRRCCCYIPLICNEAKLLAIVPTRLQRRQKITGTENKEKGKKRRGSKKKGIGETYGANEL